MKFAPTTTAAAPAIRRLRSTPRIAPPLGRKQFQREIIERCEYRRSMHHGAHARGQEASRFRAKRQVVERLQKFIPWNGQSASARKREGSTLSVSSSARHDGTLHGLRLWGFCPRVIQETPAGEVGCRGSIPKISPGKRCWARPSGSVSFRQP